MKEKSEYDIQAEKFLEESEARITKTYLRHGCRFESKIPTAIFIVTIETPRGVIDFKFSESIADSYAVYKDHKRVKSFVNIPDDYYVKAVASQGWEYMCHPYRVKMLKDKPSDYSILACLTSYDPGSHEDFCADFGYDTDSIKGRDTFIAVNKEYNDLCKIFTEEQMEKLQEIQ